ncbi:hypothetical protein TTHERM_00614770 (macronuclear) [Tetrahymena thermophila SB210]|uniref:Uncharacterized protein n=1 Tax=Tetrahymena thermophila (strain SB210) TaxID=312017 RepID=I7MAE0_TETTS|nr:hypothetical protein TTHERM_00614770 [Tetrahymena thermophila SB210]EAS04401.2 hypothetical protein TTHERM_00614770 [Tetrahymena thermophila SB210]|eukprot:XP_001024646.2 hypothetical protein TTHERM_00614770 [Tetrahymena thermophila SB210]
MQNLQDDKINNSYSSQILNEYHETTYSFEGFEYQLKQFNENVNDILIQQTQNEQLQCYQENLNNQFSENNSIQMEDFNLIQFPQGLNYENSQLNPIFFEGSQEYINEKDVSNQQNKTDSQKIINKRQSNNKQIKYESFFITKNAPQSVLGLNKKFYLFLDQMIDLDYFANIKSPNEYIQNNCSVQLTKGFRFLNKVLHRIDNKYIEVEIEYLDRQTQSIDYIIQILKSLGNQDLIKYISCLSEFQKNIQNCKKCIQKQSLKLDFIQNRLQREKAANEKFKQLTSNLNPTKLIFYQRYSVNYETFQYESTVAGYSPAFYEVLNNGSYHFKDYLLKNGYFDPMSPLFRLGEFFYRVCYFSSNLPQDINDDINKQANLELITVDNYTFPVTMQLSHQYLEKDFDIQNNLEFQFYDLLAVYEFTFKSQYIYKSLIEARQKNIINSCISETNLSDNIDLDQKDYVQTEFFQKYYQDDIQNLLKRGNKWNKVCGFQDITKKKLKQEEKRV